MPVRGLLLSSLLQVSLTDWALANCLILQMFLSEDLWYSITIWKSDSDSWSIFLYPYNIAWSHQPVVHYVVSTLAKLHIVWAGPVWVTWFSDGKGHVRMAVVRGGGPGAEAGCCVHSCSGTCCHLPFQDMPRHFFHKFVPLSGLKTVGTWFTYIFLQVLLSCI